MKRIVKITYIFGKEDKRYFKNRCEYLNLTQVEIAKRLGITPVYLNYLFNGIRPVSEEILQKLRDLGFSFMED